ncbi:GNAT family N-acetyltransferase [Thalassotalea sp. 1_MG-2023]|uniref:GNAT family N-acetyltransferase n=1 Tax=Thalassotalea sp. 1_MG-2023 TaxID=3062680 RepID=UPI0026E398F0|nr:GNAT family N-acetyltransferase [Thalassotalea sp. 1_MG-2023]MDO6427536.1 GNAT family N-acetyltransferase [Thalassotalea sp. 1_MG-2023]
MSLTIRSAVIEDAPTILHFIRELAIYEKAENEVHATVATIESSMFNANSGVHGLICELNGDAIGFAVYFYNYSTWLAKPGLYLEDLYVSPQYRGKGAGIALLKHLAQTAVNKECGRFEWSCLDWNTPSREFYESLGAEPQPEWVGYRMAGDTLSNFAQS